MKNPANIIAIALAAAMAAAVARGAESAETPDLDWREVSEIGTDGQAWKGEKFPYPYARIPLKFKGNVTKNVWANSLTPTGMSATFETDSDQIWISREFLQDNPTRLVPEIRASTSTPPTKTETSGGWRPPPIARIKDNSKTYKLSNLLGGKKTDVETGIGSHRSKGSAKRDRDIPDCGNRSYGSGRCGESTVEAEHLCRERNGLYRTDYPCV